MIGKIFGIFSGFLKDFVVFKYSNRIKKDKELFALFLDDFPVDGECHLFLKEHDLGASFPYSNLHSLNALIERWNEPDRIFLTKKLEAKKEELINCSKGFLGALNPNIYPNRIGNMSIGMRDWEDRKEIIDLKEELNALATNVADIYSEFILLCRKTL